MEQNEIDLRSGVFLDAVPTNYTLKACSLFWERIFVFEGVMQEIFGDDDTYELTQLLFDKNVLKVVEAPKVFEQSLEDKIYYGLGKEKWEYLKSNASNIAVDPQYPKDLEQIAEKAAESDSQNEVLIETIKNNGLTKIQLFCASSL